MGLTLFTSVAEYSNLFPIIFWIFVCSSILYLVWDAIHTLSDRFFRDGIVQSKYPWYVRIDMWIYACEIRRVGREAVEYHVWFGGLFCKQGASLFLLK